MIEFDCHAHIFERAHSVPGARYAPTSPAPLSDWVTHLARHDLKGGVIVQVSFLGTDNSQLCAALAQLDPRHFCGIGVVPLDVTDAALDDLVATGVRGLRWNLVRGADIPDMGAVHTQTFFEKLRARNLHLEVHLEGLRLADTLAPLLRQGVRLVVDHFGLPSDPDPDADPMIAAVRGLPDTSNIFFKLSGHYRSAFDLAPHAQALLDALPPDHFVWGSDWPHTQHESQTCYDDAFQALQSWTPWTDGRAVKNLYGIESTAHSKTG